MRHNRLMAALSCGALLSTAALAAEAPPVKPHIAIIATGGTIAGSQSSDGSQAYTAGKFDVQKLIDAAPQMNAIATVTGDQLVNIGSQDMNNAIWLKLAARTQALLDQPDVDAVVITHGTDTMEETSYFLSLTVKTHKPIVLVGSMRPATSLSADGPMNLYEAVLVAANPQSHDRGTLVVMNDQIYYARDVEKTNTTDLDTFKDTNRGPGGHVIGSSVVYFDPPTTLRAADGNFAIAGLTELPKVQIVYASANMGRSFIDLAVKEGDQGIVVAGVGDGNMTTTATAGLADAVKAGVAGVRSSRVGSGAVYRNIEVDDDKLSFIAANTLNPQKARVLLMLALTKTHDVRALQEYFDRY
jgi:L-asparaginase